MTNTANARLLDDEAVEFFLAWGNTWAPKADGLLLQIARFLGSSALVGHDWSKVKGIDPATLQAAAGTIAASNAKE